MKSSTSTHPGTEKELPSKLPLGRGKTRDGSRGSFLGHQIIRRAKTILRERTTKLNSLFTTVLHGKRVEGGKGRGKMV